VSKNIEVEDPLLTKNSGWVVGWMDEKAVYGLLTEIKNQKSL
jgi:hypothetical protein